MTRRILFVPLHAPSLLEMMPVATRVAADGQYQPSFFLHHNPGNFTDEHIRMLKQAGMLIVEPWAASKLSPIPPHVDRTKQLLALAKRMARWIIPGRLRLILRRHARKAIPTTVRRIVNMVKHYKLLVKEAHALLRRQSVAALVLMGDRHVGWETALVKAANQLGIPSLIVPVSLSAPEGAARYRLRQRDAERFYGMQRLSNRIAGMLFPQWVYEFEGRRLLFYPVPRAMAAWFSGTISENPWTLGGGAATRMAVESPRLRCMFIEQGVPAEKMVVTGKPSLDQMYEAMRPANQRMLKEDLGIPETERMLLCAVPQLAEHGFMPWPQHWQEIEFLLTTFAQLKNISIVLSLHPKSNPSDYQSLADRYGTIIAKRRIYELLPACDVFVADFSSTVVQAIGIGKPAVVVDFYGYNYILYDDAPGVIVLRSRDQLQSTLTRLFSDPEYYQQLAQAQRQQASEWILLDGKCTERVVDELYRLIENPVRDN